VIYGPQYGHRHAFPHPPPPDPPELPEGASPYPRWPAWYGPAAFGTAIALLILMSVVVSAIRIAAGGNPSHSPHALTQALTFVLDAILIGVAVFFAARTARPRLAHFGLRRARLWPTLGWAALGFVAFWIVNIVYVAILRPDGKQDVVKELGAQHSTPALVAGGLLVIAVAPLAEEFFFRGFFYRALRSRMGVLLAATLDGLLFGAIHYDNPKSLVLLPVLALLGFVFCLVYERTGTLFATIGLHSLNNCLAYGSATHDWGIAGAIGAAVLAACVVTPRVLHRAPAVA
jgi:membrane protease YdiL (CAAX protease family)